MVVHAYCKRNWFEVIMCKLGLFGEKDFFAYLFTLYVRSALVWTHHGGNSYSWFNNTFI